ncbi:surface-adhesin E family protein [Phenylobacterium sp.]|uniref:surface-adhesin E family protein n=1 Tax=Phenylobacterium sp. TaxID=1871053 RepID=UPI0027321C0A|nr:surface-adhesin E family protein [Phenylobacterium sp.]MDP2213349.1 hypothetical protein [Phenylobacterium sp.]
MGRGKFFLSLGCSLVLAVSQGHAQTAFRFEEQTSVEEMRALILRDFSDISTREQVRATFVDQGSATLRPHPRNSDIEKYIYDINLCGYYVWRWNISADYRTDGRLMQLYVNAEPVLGDAKPADAPKKGPFYRADLPRPQAFKGEASLAVIFADRDGDLETVDDQDILTGVGPTNVDPLNMGRAYPYHGEVWRSIFDGDDAGVVMPYAGDCVAVHTGMLRLVGDKATPLLKSSPSTGGNAQSAPKPATLGDAGLRSWLADHIETDEWVLIAASDSGVTLGGPAGVIERADGTLSALVRREYFSPMGLGDMDSQSNLQSWSVDCENRRLRVLNMAIYEGSNLTGSSQAQASTEPPWSRAEANSANGYTVKRICEAPTTGQRRK